MKDEKIIDISLKERIRLDKSYINYHDIIDKNLPYKFAYLDEWLLKIQNYSYQKQINLNQKVNKCIKHIKEALL